MTKEYPQRKNESLRRGRVSIPGARYFITCCVNQRKRGLVCDEVAHSLLSQWEVIAEPDGRMLCAVIMPDHVHWLFVLGERLRVGQIVGRWKSKTSQLLKNRELEWQEDFFEHRLRPEDSSDSYGRYMFMNPYRAGLIALNQQWPWWRCWEPRRFKFMELLSQGLYPHESWQRATQPWLREREETEDGD